MEKNKSLSARIKRRNAQGFTGTGYHNGAIPVYGDYNDPMYNHKHPIVAKIDDKTGLYEPVVTLTPHQHMINNAKRHGVHHAGSKKMSTLLSHF